MLPVFHLAEFPPIQPYVLQNWMSHLLATLYKGQAAGVSK